MKPTVISITALACLGSFVLADAATAQGLVAPGTEFPAAPISKGGISLLAPVQVLAPAPPPGPAVAPAPEPTPKKRRKRRKS